MLRHAIQRPIAVLMLFAALFLIGVISYVKLPVDLLPSITYPRLTIITTYEDIPAEDLERLVTQPLEEIVTGLSKVRNVVSRTREGVSTITVEYEWGTQMDFANLHLREAIDRVAFRDDFPEEAERPVILRWDPTSRPISVLTLRGDRRIEALTEFAREVLKPALEQVDGISQAEVVGGADREIVVQPDPRKLAIYGITMNNIRSALARSNISFPGGKIRQGPLHLSLRIAGEYETLEEISDTDIVRPGRSPVRISDVAKVLDTVKEAEGVTLLGAVPVVSVLLYKEPEANTIQVSEEVDTALLVVQEDYGDFEFEYVYQDAEYVRASFQGLVQSLLLGAFLALIVLFVFLRDLLSPLVVGMAIPISITITFGLLYFGDVKLNLMSLGGLSLAAGMLVDNSIVVLENINRHLAAAKRRLLGVRGDQEESGATLEPAPPSDASESTPADPGAADGGPPRRFEDLSGIERKRFVAAACERGGREMARPVIAATLTTVAVFFPVVYVPGIAGAFFRDQALTVTFSLLVSITTALLLQPVLTARALRWDLPAPRLLFAPFRIGFDALHHAYHGALERALRRPRTMLLLLVVGLVATGVVGSRLERSFMPQRSSGDLRLDVELPAGTPLEETEANVALVAETLEDDPAVAHVFSQVGRTERTLAAMQDYTAPNTGRVRIILKPQRGAWRQGLRIQRELSTQLSAMPEVTFAFREEGIGLGEILAVGEAPFTLGIMAEEPHTAVAVANELYDRLQDVPGLTDLQVDRVLGTPNLVVRLDREEILRSGLDPDVVAQELRYRIGGVEATTFNEVEQRIDIAVRFAEEQRRDLSMALTSPVQVAGGRTVPLRSFLDVVEERPVRELVRKNQRRMVTISGDIQGSTHSQVWAQAMSIASSLDVPGDVTFAAGGEREAMRKSFRDLGWAMLLAVLLVYMILAAQFESFMDPLLIAAVIPIGLAGSILAIGVSGNSINILSLIGVLALLGIAVNDAIVKIDTIRRLRSEGVEPHQAVLQASRLRFRPILMTSVTTVLAMVPMAIGLGSGEQLQRPLAVTIIGGLSLTTTLTLFYTPILYEMAHRIRGGRR
ncbi:MAG: efflux RND transporter permease subunit [Candidatus Latescibacterota bacterium]|nr:MAG: efflux RND transporter permease subunit [Candidatus Latescibacterota bacterium]